MGPVVQMCALPQRSMFDKIHTPTSNQMVNLTQGTGARRSATRRRHQSAPPGIGLTIAIAAISGVVCWFWLVSGRANPPDPSAPNVSDLTEVEKDDIAGALTTMNLPGDVAALVREAKDDGCRRPIAWVTLVSAPGEPPSRIRLISGDYFSPLFEVSATPVRVALPFPAPYETGHGVLTAIDVGGSAAIALRPAWRVSARDGNTTRPVFWHPVNKCSPRNG
jgi:hypothetical protein